ncbi:hypothetical protein FQA39_LY17720 [Lamprigera yunnana]|nr:hypothetical protein FQA39_LY17720 [Lamprigera yunnana]
MTGAVDVTLLYAYHTTNHYFPEKVPNPIVTIDVTKEMFNTKNYKFYNEMVILDIPSLKVINMFLPVMSENGLMNMKTTQKRKYLVIIPNFNFYLKQFFFHLFHTGIIDIMILTFNPKAISDTITVFSTDPRAPENQCGKVVKSVQSYKYDTIHLIRKPGVLDKYGSCVVTNSVPARQHLYRYTSTLHYLFLFVVDIISETLNVTIKPVIGGEMDIKDERLFFGSSGLF